MTSRKDDVVAAIEGAEILRFPVAGARASSSAVREDGTAAGGSQKPPPSGGQKGGGRSDADEPNAFDRKLGFLPLTDLGNAKRFHARYQGKLLYCEQLGWFAWDGRRWNREMASGAVQLAEHTTVSAIQAEAAAVADSDQDFIIATKGTKKEPIEIFYSDQVRAWGRTSECGAHLTAVSRNAQALFEVAPDALDRDPMRFNVLNGTLRFSRDIAEGYAALEPHRAEDFITKLAPVHFDPLAECPLFDAFLARVQPGAAERRFLAQWGGLSLTADTGEQKLTFHYGKGRNGKGVWVSTIKHTIGDYAGAIRIESFLDSGRAQAGGQATPDIAKLVGVRFLSTSEPKKGAVLDEGLVKLFTGEDIISARHLNKGFFDFQPCAKLTMQGNYRPKISGTDEGIWNRMVLVPWPVFIPKEERDLKLATKLRGETSGVLNRLLDGLRDWLDHGLVLPDAVVAATAEYRADSDPLGRFLETCTQQALGQRVQSSDMHALFAAWAKANGETEWTPKGLAMALKERGVPAKKSVNVYWLDLMLTKRVSDFIDGDGKPVRHAHDGVDFAAMDERAGDDDARD